MSERDLAELPRFVQGRAYEKGMAVARIVRDPERRFGVPTIEGTRVSPMDLAGYLDDSAETTESIAEDFSLTIEQVVAAREWLAAHPECPKCHGRGGRGARVCRTCGGEGRLISETEKQEVAEVEESVRRLWAEIASSEKAPTK